MSRRQARAQSRTRGGRSASGRSLLVLVALLPVLLVGPAVGGMTAWFHSHGPAGEHLHLLTEHVDAHRHGTLHDWHDAQHGLEAHERADDAHEGGREAGEEGVEYAPTGLVIELPRILAAPYARAHLASATSIHSAPSIHLPALLPTLRQHLVFGEGPGKNGPCRSGWPPQRAKRIGVAALLCSSHAILI